MVIFIGGPGSGKGIQSRLLHKRNGFKIFALGEILRAEIAKKSEIGELIGKTINSGRFAGIDVVMALLESNVTHSNFVLDGFPRNLEQAEAFEKFVEKKQHLFTSELIVVDFVVDDHLLIERLNNRKICNECDASILDEYDCLFCGTSACGAYKRCDDDVDTILERLNQYHTQSKPLVEFYKDKGMYCAIDAMADVESVYTQLTSCINAKNLF